MKKIIEKRENGSTRVRTYFDPSKNKNETQQHFKTECDINHIMKKYKTTGQITHLSEKTGRYMDVSSAPDLKQALKISINAQEAFNSLDAHIRKRFGNDPIEFLQFLDDPKNADEAIKLGLLKKLDSMDDDSTTTQSNQKNKKSQQKPPATPPQEEAD